MRLLRKIAGLLVRGTLAYENISMLGIIFMALVIVTEVTLRLFNISVFPLVDICGITLIIITFTSIGALFIIGRHLRVGITLERMPNRQRQLVEAIQGILALVLTIIFTYLWWQMAYGMFKHEAHFEIMKLPVWPFQIFIIIGWLALIIGEIYFIVNKIKLFRHSS